MNNLMSAPYARFIVMQITIAVGGVLVKQVDDPVPALVMLVLLKVIADLRGHYGERTRAG